MSKPDCHMCDLKQRHMWAKDTLWIIYVGGSMYDQVCSHHIGIALESIKDKIGISVSAGERPHMESWAGPHGVPVTEYEIQRLVRIDWTEYQRDALVAADKDGYLDNNHKDISGRRWNEATLKALAECLEPDPNGSVRYWLTEAGAEVARRLEERGDHE